MRPWLAFALALATLASGCAGSDTDPAPATGEDTADDTGNATLMLPAVTHFEFGPSGGCAGDLITTADSVAGQGLNCVSFMQGVDGGGIDGHWLALNESYWGLQLTSTIVQSPTGPASTPVITALNDSDCVVTDKDLRILANGNNNEQPCGLVVPQETAYLFIYPYGSPATEITVDVQLPA